MDEKVISQFARQCARSKHAPVLVLDSSVNGLSYVRSLSRKGIPLLCADSKKAVASRSRFGLFMLLETRPDDSIDGEQAADELIARLNALGIMPVAFGAADQWQVYLARRAAEENCGVRTLVPARATMETIIDKQAQYEAAAKLDIPVAAFANAREVFARRAPWTTFPAIIKPRWAHVGRTAIGGKAVRVHTETEMRQMLESLDREVDVSAYIVQEIISGGDNCLYGFLALYDADGREISWLVKRKLRQYPPTFGDGSLDVTCVNDRVADTARKLLRGMAYRGLVGVEFKVDPETDDLTLIEINPRTVSTNQLAVRAGVDFPWLAYCLVTGQDPGDMALPSEAGGLPYRLDVHHVNEEREFRLFLLRRRAGETNFVEWLRCVLSAGSHSFWDRTDPWPFLWALGSGLRKRMSRRAE